MTTDSAESSSEDIHRIRNEHRRASHALLQLSVLRDQDEYRTPTFDPDSQEGWLRNQVFRLHHELLNSDSYEELIEPRDVTLAEALSDHRLNDFATPGRALTRHRLMQIDPELCEIADQMEEQGIGWPDDESAVGHDVIPEDFDDYTFGSKLVYGGQAYNNFPAILSVKPNRPSEGENLVNFMTRVQLFQDATKPYLARAHALAPVFMDALQRRMSELPERSLWEKSLFRVVSEEHADSEDRILLRGSRLAYQLLINLMRADDLATQATIVGTTTGKSITDPVEELWT
ncbi:MAG: hypothetical protein QG649_757 [Patescibacteria group bacterium]|nr:hypothetical protein [Patescibacteria group bacterium]